MYLITDAAWASGKVSDSVVELLRGKGEPVRVLVSHNDGRAGRFRELGAEVNVADLTCAADVVEAMRGVTRMFFNTHISFDYLQEVAIVCAAARELGGLEMVVNMSQMTVSQMTLTSSEESHQQRLFWLAEQIMNWSGVPVVHVRPTLLLDNPLFTVLARRSVRERDVLALPFGAGRTSPIAAEDVAQVVAALLLTPPKAGQVYGLTGAQVLDLEGLAEQYSRRWGARSGRKTFPTMTGCATTCETRAIRPRSAASRDRGAVASREPLRPLHDDFEQVTGQPPQTVEQYVASHPEVFAEIPVRWRAMRRRISSHQVWPPRSSESTHV